MSDPVKTQPASVAKAAVSNVHGNAWRRSTPDESQLNSVPPIVQDVLHSPGQPLDAETREFMEQRFGHDFSRVRVHIDGAAAKSARAVNAVAYAFGRDIVFDAGEYAPNTSIGRNLLAHELTHTIQQRIGLTGNLADAEREADQAAEEIGSDVHHQNDLSNTMPGHDATLQRDRAISKPTLMMRGRTVGGFFANIFQFWNYSKKTLDAYLGDLDRSNQIQGDDDSDDMARQVVTEWKEDKTRYNLSPTIRILLIREMLDGVVSGSDQERIMDLLDGAKMSELEIMFRTSRNPLTYQEIDAKFDSQKPHLKLFNENVLENLNQQKSAEPKDAQSIEKRLQDVEKKTGIEFRDLSISFQIAASDLSKSFLVNITVPKPHVTVTITLTRSFLRVRFDPSLLVDVIWPVSNAWLKEFTLMFAGLKPKLGIEGTELISDIAQNKVEKQLRGLFAGTRFEDPGYNPLNDPQLLSTEVLGELNRIRYNFEKNAEKSEGDTTTAQDVSNFSLSLNLRHKAGLPIPSEGWGVVIVPGTKFNLQIETLGTAAELKKKNLRFLSLRIVTDRIFLYKGRDKIAMLTSLEMKRGLKIKLGGVQSFVDLKELLRQEYPGKFSDAAADYLKKYDNWADSWNNFVTLGGLLGDPGPKSDIAQSIAVAASENVLGWVVGQVLSEHWDEIRSKLGITDKQLEQFFGL